MARRPLSDAERLEVILGEPGARRAFEALAEACGRLWLEQYVTDPVESKRRAEDSGSRRNDLRTIRAFYESLRKSHDLMGQFCKLTSEPLAIRFEVDRKPGSVIPVTIDAFWQVKPRRRVYLSDALEAAMEQVKAWAERPRPALVFTGRQAQQLKLPKRIHDATGKWQLARATKILAAIYKHQSPEIPETEHPTEKSLARLARRFLANQERWKSRR
jgi:hypothetical protein